MNVPARRLAWVLAWLVGTAATLSFTARPTSAPLDEDELYWIGSAYYFHLALAQGDWGNADWSLLPARENPPVAKYVLGLGLALHGQHVASLDLLGTFYLLFERVPGAWGTGVDGEKRAAVVHRMTPAVRDQLRAGAQVNLDPALLFPARYTALVCGVAASILILLLGFKTGGPLGGIIASQLFLLHPAVAYAYNHAVSDAPALLFSAAAALAGHSFLASAHISALGPTRRLLRPAGIAGALVALACGAKMNALVIGFAIGVFAIVATSTAWRRERKQGVRFALATAFFGAVAILTFIVINPATHSDIVEGLRATVREHRLTESIQASFLSGHLVTPIEKFLAVGTLSVFSGLLLAALILSSIFLLRSRNPPVRFLGGWFLIAAMCVIAWIPFSRGRYVLPVVLPATLIIGHLVLVAFSAGWSWFTQRQGPSSPAIQR